MQLEKYIRNIPDFPKPGIQFKDITPLLASPEAFRECVSQMAAPFKGKRIAKVAAIEARGFLFAPYIAGELNAGIIPLRKPGKLPFTTVQYTYSLEYGEDTIEMHTDAVANGEKVLIVDDLLATGGTVHAACQLIEKAGGVVEGVSFLIELAFLEGRKKISGYTVESLIKF